MARSVDDFLLDFSKEEAGGGGNRIKVKDGWHFVKILSAKTTVSAQKSTPGLQVTFKFLDGKYKGKKIEDTLWLSPKAMSRFRTLLAAVGKTVKATSKLKMSAVIAALKGQELYIETETEESEGYADRSRVTFQGFQSEEDYDPDEEGDEEDEDEEDDDIEDDEDDVEDEDEEEEEPAPKKRTRKPAAKKAPARKRKAAPEPDEDDEDDLDDEEEDDDEPEPPKRKRAAKKAPAKRTKKKAPVEDEDDDEDLDSLDLDDL